LSILSRRGGRERRFCERLMREFGLITMMGMEVMSLEDK